MQYKLCNDFFECVRNGRYFLVYFLEYVASFKSLDKDMPEIIVPPKLLLVANNLSKNALLLYLLAMSELNEINYIMGYAHPIFISAEKWQKHFHKSENPYKDIRRALNKLRKHNVNFEKSNNPVKVFEKIIYKNKQGCVEIHFNPDFLRLCI